MYYCYALDFAYESYSIGFLKVAELENPCGEVAPVQTVREDGGRNGMWKCESIYSRDRQQIIDLSRDWWNTFEKGLKHETKHTDSSTMKNVSRD